MVPTRRLAARYAESQPVHRSRYCAEEQRPRLSGLCIGTTMVPRQPHGNSSSVDQSDNVPGTRLTCSNADCECELQSIPPARTTPPTRARAAIPSNRRACPTNAWGASVSSCASPMTSLPVRASGRCAKVPRRPSRAFRKFGLKALRRRSGSTTSSPGHVASCLRVSTAPV